MRKRFVTGVTTFGFACLLVLSSYRAAAAQITLHLAGDSTMSEKLSQKRPETGWGEKLQQFFDPEKIKIVNHAKNGRSTRTFIAEGLWDGILRNLSPGDYVLIQFGHNDASPQKVDRYTPPADYQANLARFVAEVRERKAHPILMTPIVRRRFNERGEFLDSHGEYPQLVRSIASQHNVPLIDMQRKSEELLRRYGVEESRKFFLQLRPGENSNYPAGIEDNTHFNDHGAQVMAQLVIEGIKELKLALASCFKE